MKGIGCAAERSSFPRRVSRPPEGVRNPVSPGSGAQPTSCPVSRADISRQSEKLAPTTRARHHALRNEKGRSASPAVRRALSAFFARSQSVRKRSRRQPSLKATAAAWRTYAPEKRVCHCGSARARDEDGSAELLAAR